MDFRLVFCYFIVQYATQSNLSDIQSSLEPNQIMLSNSWVTLFLPKCSLHMFSRIRNPIAYDTNNLFQPIIHKIHFEQYKFFVLFITFYRKTKA